jgi:transcriptional regulator with XRE-family HTH domain
MSQIQTVIRELRESQSQEQIAAQVDASQSLISRWESGAVPAAVAIAMRLVELHRAALSQRPSQKESSQESALG